MAPISHSAELPCFHFLTFKDASRAVVACKVQLIQSWYLSALRAQYRRETPLRDKLFLISAVSKLLLRF